MTTGPLTTAELDAAMRAVVNSGQKVRLRNGTEITRANLKELEGLRAIAAQTEIAGANRAPVMAAPLSFNNDL